MSLFDNIDEQEHNQILQQSRERFWTSYDKECKDLPNLSDSPMEITIKPEALDVSQLEEDDSHALWRPLGWEEYIGQENLKNILQGYIRGCKERDRKFPHLLIDGHAGTGKTTIINLIAHQLQVPFVECITNTIQSPQQFVDKLAECKGGILFLDELQEINRKVANFILPLLEDFKINGKKIKPFTLAGATTEKGILIKKYKPLVDRMKIQKTLEPYTLQELEILTKQYKNKMFPDQTIEEGIYQQIARNCRGTPRIAIRYIESYIFMNCSIEKVFRSYGIIKDGFTKDDIKILHLLEEKDKGVGLKSLSAYLGTSEANYLYQIEQYLLEQGLITIANRRVITETGKQFLKEIS